MKIQRRLRKGRGMRAILCMVVSVLCIAFSSVDVLAGYNSDNHPSVVFSPDGTGWTLIDELPYCEDYHVSNFASDYMFPFWTEDGTIIETGEDSRTGSGKGWCQHLKVSQTKIK